MINRERRRDATGTEGRCTRRLNKACSLVELERPLENAPSNSEQEKFAGMVDRECRRAATGWVTRVVVRVDVNWESTR